MTEKYRRVYLPHFMQRAQYKTNIYTTQLNLNIFEENEEKLEFVFNFDRMVHNIRALKDKVSGTLVIKNRRKTPITLKIENDRFIISVEQNIIINEDISDTKTIKSFVAEMNKKIFDIKFEYEGNNEDISFLKFNAPILLNKGKQKIIQIEDNTYKNCTDVIENGAMILTDRYRLYQVIEARPATDSYGNLWCSWICKGALAELSVADAMPGDYRTLIEKNRYWAPKVKME
jgi:hypothetical protein